MPVPFRFHRLLFAFAVLLASCCAHGQQAAPAVCAVGQLGDPCRAGAQAGNPVNLVTGNKYQQEVDLPALPGPLGIEVVRHYNSQSNGSGPMGNRWRLSYDTRVTTQRGAAIQIVQADGKRLIFSRNAADPSRCLSANAEDGSVHIIKPNNGEEVINWNRADGQQLRFDSNGMLIGITAPSGDNATLERDGQGRLLSVTDPQNRKLTIHYGKPGDAWQGIIAISGPTGMIRYAHTPPGPGFANLARVQYPDGSVRDYHYTADEPQRDAAGGLYRHPDQQLLTGISIRSSANAPAQRIGTYGYNRSGFATLSMQGNGVGRITLDHSTAGQVTLTNSLGQHTVYKYTVAGNQYRVTEAIGPGCSTCAPGNRRYSWTPTGQLTSESTLDATGRTLATTRYERDMLGRETARQRELPDAAPQQTHRFTYRSTERQPMSIARPSTVPGREALTVLAYNDFHQITKVTETGWSPSAQGQPTPLERTTRYTYRRGGDRSTTRSVLVRIDGPQPNGPAQSPADSDITELHYDQHDRFVTSVTAPGQRVTRVQARDAAGRPTALVLPGGIALRYTYDQRGRVASIERAGLVDRLQYNTHNQLASVTRATGAQLHLTYHPDGRLAGMADAQGNRIEVKRDTEGNLLSRTLLNPDGSLAQQTDLARYAHDAQAPPADPDAADTAGGATLQRDVDGLPRALLEPGDIATRITWEQQRTTRITDARNRDTRYQYDDFGRLASVVSPDAGTSLFSYDAANNLTEKMLAAGTADSQRIRYRYDIAGRVVRQQTPEGETRIVYGEHGRPTRISFPAGVEEYRYDSAARLAAHTRTIDGQRFTTAYTYDARGQPSEKTLPDGQVLQYHYNGPLHAKPGVLNAITRRDLRGQTVLLAGLNDAGDRYADQQYTLANQVPFRRQLDQQGRTVSIGSAGYWQERQQYAAAGQLAQRILPGGRTGYAYDPLGRMASISHQPGAGPAAIEDYRYDQAGNLQQHRAGDTLTSYQTDPASNRIQTASTGATRQDYRYNAAGSVTHIGSRTFQWDSQQRLVKVSDAGKLVAEYSYNPFGERIKKVRYANNQKSVTYYFYDGSQMVAEAQADGNSATVTRQYVWLEDQHGTRPIALLQRKDSVAGALLSVVSAAAGRATGTDVYAIVADHTGAPRALVDAHHNTAWQVDITGYGQAIPGKGNRIELNLRGSNQYHDSETGLHYNTRRYLDPGSGRYLSTDPSGQAGGINLYAFARNNPLANIDPLGLQDKPVAGMGFDDKLKIVFEHAAEKLPAALGEELKQLVSPENLAGTVAIFALWGASHAVGVGFVADIAMVGMAYYTLGSAAIDFVTGVLALVDKINDAKCEKDLDEASATLAQVSAMLAMSVGNKTGGKGTVGTVFKGAKKKLGTKAVVKIDNAVLGRKRTGSASKMDPMHSFPDWVDNYVADATKFNIPTKGPGGVVIRQSELYQIEGSLNGKRGIFEWIVDKNEVTHRRFIPNGQITGAPNQIPGKP